MFSQIDVQFVVGIVKFNCVFLWFIRYMPIKDKSHLLINRLMRFAQGGFCAEGGFGWKGGVY